MQIRGTNGEVVQHTNIVSLYVPRSLVGPGTWPTLPPEWIQAEKDIKELNAHPPVPGSNGYWLLWDLSGHSYQESDLPVPVGPAGPPNVLEIGTVETLPADQQATASITGESPAQKLNLGIPRGQTGKTGATPALEIGQVETLEPGQPATAEFSGTPEAPVLSLGIPQGQPGKDGPANTLEIGTVETLEPGQTATAQITGEAPNQTLSLGIPRGQTGKTGATPALEIGQVETLEPGEPATAELSGTPEKPVLNLGIPRGQTGKTGATPALEIGQVETLEPGQPATAEFSGTPEAPVLSLGIPQGQPGKDGPANTLEIGTVETLEPGQTATAQITGEAPNQTLSLGIPRGQTGKTGATPALEIGQVETLEPDQPATAEFSGTPEKPVLSLGIPQGQPGKDGVQLNDNAVNTTEAWSSKKIVDTLCPSFSVSGNPVTCHPVEGYPLSAVVSLEPKQAGSGDPSPENVRPISGWDEVTVNVRGKNVVDVDDIPVASVGSSGYYFETLLPFKLYVGVTFTLSANVTCLTESYTDGWKLELGAGNTAYQYDISLKSVFTKEQGARISITGTALPEASIYENLAFRLRLERKTPYVKFEITNIMLEVNDTPTPYEPYQPGTTATLTLPETIYGGTVDAVRGVGSKTWGYIASYNGEALPGERISDRDVYSAGASPTTGAQVAYKLATPEPFQATGNQPIPALAGENTVYTDGDSLDVTGRQDLLYTLQNMQAQTQNLNRFIAEGGTQ